MWIFCSRAATMVLAVWATACFSAGAAETVTLPAVADTTLRELLPTLNSGTAGDLRIGTLGPNGSTTRNRGLFQFDPAAVVPSGAIITSAQLNLTVTRATNVVPFDFELRRMLVPWKESEANWALRQAPDVTWAASGGAEGVDYSAAASAVASVPGPGSFFWGSTTGMVADVQRWLTNPSKNYGWMLLTSSENVPQSARLFASREYPVGTPALAVEYILPLRVISALVATNAFCLQFETRAGKAYVVERREHVDNGAWTVVTNLPPAAADESVTICDPLTTGNRFYRVGEQ